MTRADLIALAARVEALEGPCRETDAEIMFDLFAKPTGTHKEDCGPIGYLWPADHPSWSFGIRFPGKSREWFTAVRKRIDGETLLIERDGALVLMNALRISAPTASLDAVVALIERELPGWAWDVGCYHDAFRCESGPPFAADLIGNVREESRGWGEPQELAYDNCAGKGSAACRALLAAFLRARASKGETDGR